MADRPHVALLIETSNHYGRELLRGIRAWEQAHGPWALRLVEQSRGATVPRWLRTWHGDGVIARVEDAGIARALRATKLPVVDVSAAVARPVFPQVLTDSRAVIELAWQHLRERGLEHFAYVGTAGFRWSVQRGAFWTERAAREGRTVALFPVRERTPEADERTLIAWLRALPKPVGVLACYDIRGQEVLQACREAGLRVPEEVAVLGVHNDRLLCELCDPPLSSVIPDAQTAGREAAARLAALMAGQAIEADVTLIAPLGVETRQSTDLVAVADARVAAAVRFVRAQACAGINVADVLRAVPMARTALERRMKLSLGCTPRELIERTRLEHVRRWLAETDAPVAAIAERTGFAHPEYLTVAFRRAEGVTPRAWRTKRRGR